MAIHPTRVHKATLSFNEKLVSKLANLAGSPWAIWVSLAISLSSLPSVLAQNNIALDVQWLSGTCIQLVMLFVLQSKAVMDGNHSEQIANAIYDNAVRAEKAAEEILDRLYLLERGKK